MQSHREQRRIIVRAYLEGRLSKRQARSWLRRVNDEAYGYE